MKNRLFYIDVARCSACLLVVASHIFAPICAAIKLAPHPIWWLFNGLDSVIRPSAAIYVMISGVLFLGSSKEESYFTFVRKRYAKLLLPFLVWSFIYAFYNVYGQDTPFHWGHAAMQILQGPTCYHLWFMYMILALYLVMPVLRGFIRQAQGSDVAIFLTIWLGFLTLRFFAPGYVGESPATTLLSYGGYAVLGLALARTDYLQKRTSLWGILWLGIVIFNAVGTYMLTPHNAKELNERLYFGAAPLVAIQAAAMFVLFKTINQDSFLFRISALRNTIKLFSRHSYNIYLNHALWIAILSNTHSIFNVAGKTGAQAIWSVVLTMIATLVGSLGLAVLVERIPILSTLLILSPSRPTPEFQTQTTSTTPA